MKTETPDLPEAIDLTLPRPIEINGEKVSDFVLTREPTGNDLGRHTFPDLLDGNIRALAAVTPKIIQPYISPATIKSLGSTNIMAIQMAFNAFFEGVDLEAIAKPKVHTNSTTTKSPQHSSSGPKAD